MASYELPVVVPEQGPKDAVIAFIGASPSVIDTIRQRPFCGPGGETLHDLYLKALGLERSDVLLMNLVPDLLVDERGKAREPTDDEVNAYAPYLLATLAEMNPQFIVALGRVAKRALNNIADTWLPHPLAVRLHGDTGEVARKLRRVKQALDAAEGPIAQKMFYVDELDWPTKERWDAFIKRSMKREGEYLFPYHAYAEVGDRFDAETFQFRVWESPTKRQTLRQVQKACDEYAAADVKPDGLRETLLLHWHSAGGDMDEFPIPAPELPAATEFTIKWKMDVESGSSTVITDGHGNPVSSDITNPDPSQWSYTANTILKVNDDEKRLVYGIVMEPGTFDSHMDFTSAEEIEHAAHQYLIDSRVVGQQHREAAAADVVESFIAPTDMAFGDELVRSGSWLMGVRVNDDDLWTGVKEGSYTGFSIGGFATKQ